MSLTISKPEKVGLIKNHSTKPEKVVKNLILILDFEIF